MITIDHLPKNVWLVGRDKRVARTQAVVMEDVPVTVVIGNERRELRRDFTFDEEPDGSWGISAYVAGQNSGSSIMVRDNAFVYLMNLLVELIIDPDNFGERKLVMGHNEGGKIVLEREMESPA